MSEFYFNYKCIAMGEQKIANPDKALTFYLFQDYDDKGSTMCVQIYVPKDIQNRYCGAKVYFSPNDVEFPDIASTTLTPTIWYTKFRSGIDREGNFICKDNCIYIKTENEELSGCGVIAFVEDDINTQPKTNDSYKFIINYSKKETISYRILEGKSKIRAEVLYPLLRENIQLGIVKKKGAKPVLVKDYNLESSILRHFNENEIIELKANGRNEDVVRKVMTVDDPRQYDYRLTFIEPRHATHYLLVDESDYTIEDKGIRQKEIAKSKKLVVHNLRCPYCGDTLKPLPREYKRGETAIVGCNGVEISNTTDEDDLKGKVTRVCSSDLVSLSKLTGSSSRSVIEANNLIIPENYEYVPTMNVAVAGFPNSGKTIYLSSIFNMSDGGTGQGIKAFPVVLNKILETFDKKRKGRNNVEEVKFLGVDKDNGFRLNTIVERTRVSPREDIKLRYVLSAGKHVEAQSPKEIAWKLSWQPIGFKMGNLGYTYFYDVPGEMFTFENKDKVRALDMANCLIAVINGAPDVEDPIGELLTTLERLPLLSESRLDMESMPIAIVFTKHDLKLTDYLGKEKNKEFCFEDNCHVVRENIIAMLPKNGKYEGSELERHIDCSSYELEHYLKARDINGKFKQLKKYSNIKFFTCSALGSDSCLGIPINGTKEVLFKPRRLRVELPIIWLMYKMGLIKR